MLEERPEACPGCHGSELIKAGRACGRQRWTCKTCGMQFTRTTPRGKPMAIRSQAIKLHSSGLSMNAIAKRLGVSGQSVFRWIRWHGQRPLPSS